MALGAGPAILTSVTAAETATLAELSHGRRVLEIGSAYGYSAVAMTLSGAWVTAVDPHHAHNSHEIMLTNLAAYGVTDHVEVVRQYSRTALPALADRGEEYDLIFIDGDHTTAGVEHDIKWSVELLRPGGTIVCHDYLETCCCPEVGPTVDLYFSRFDLVDAMAVIPA
jgi:predicted O-methyltransferase YrrM